MYFSMLIEPTIITSQVKIVSNNCLLYCNRLVVDEQPFRIILFLPRPYILGIRSKHLFLGWLDTQRDADPRILWSAQ